MTFENILIVRHSDFGNHAGQSEESEPLAWYFSGNELPIFVIPAKAGIQAWMPFGIYPAHDAGMAW